MRNKKAFIAVTIALVALCAVAVTAAGYLKTIEVSTDISLSIDGKDYVPKDVNGNPVEIFVYNGTTYVPIRGVATAFGKDVGYNNDTKTAIITTPEKADSAKKDGDTVDSFVNMMHVYYIFDTWLDSYNLRAVDYSDALLFLLINRYDEGYALLELAMKDLKAMTEAKEEAFDLIYDSFIDYDIFSSRSVDVGRFYADRIEYLLYCEGNALKKAFHAMRDGDVDGAAKYSSLYYDYTVRRTGVYNSLYSYINTHYHALRQTVESNELTAEKYLIIVEEMSKGYGIETAEMSAVFDKYKNMTPAEIAKATGDYLG
jgi:Copper amine oxidase N-terminal domain.